MLSILNKTHNHTKLPTLPEQCRPNHSAPSTTTAVVHSTRACIPSTHSLASLRHRIARITASDLLPRVRLGPLYPFDYLYESTHRVLLSRIEHIIQSKPIHTWLSINYQVQDKMLSYVRQFDFLPKKFGLRHVRRGDQSVAANWHSVTRDWQSTTLNISVIADRRHRLIFVIW